MSPLILRIHLTKQKIQARRFFLIVSIFMTLILLWGLNISSAFAETTLPDKPLAEKKVLILYSYFASTSAYVATTSRLLSTLIDAGVLADNLHQEYLDLGRHGDLEYRKNLQEFLKNKYSNVKLDLIVTLHGAAQQFVLRDCKDLWPQAQLLSLLAPGIPEPVVIGRKSGVELLKLDFRGTLERALEMFPQTRRVLFVTGSGSPELKYLEQAKAAFEPWQGKVAFEYTVGRSLDEILKRVDISAKLIAQHDNAVLVQIDVRDSGIGISHDALEFIFKPFVQEDESTDRKFGGTGLGLTISLRLAELMGGSIAVKSTPGKGSCFTLTLPFTFVQKEETGVEAPGIANNIPDGPPLRILFAEDNQTNITFGISLLKKLGHDVFVAKNGKECLAAMDKAGFDLVLMDIQMPVMNGVDALKAIREREEIARIPVIALTAYSMRGDRERFLDEGFDGYVSKPLDVNELVSEINRVMEGR